MIVNIIYFIGGVLIPHAAEQYAYRKFIGINKQPAEGNNTGIVSQGYGRRVLWDLAYFLVVLRAGYQIIFSGNFLSPLEWFGYIAFLWGVVLRVWALKELGSFYDSGIVIKKDHQIVSTGPYRFLRHPLHLGTLLKITGLSFFSPLWLGAPVVLASVLLDISLNRLEDHLHFQQFGPSFKEYYRTRWDIVDLFFWKHQVS